VVEKNAEMILGTISKVMQRRNKHFSFITRNELCKCWGSVCSGHLIKALIFDAILDMYQYFLVFMAIYCLTPVVIRCEFAVLSFIY
jgi:hypothetical protein